MQGKSFVVMCMCFQMPKDIVKVGPVLIISLLPFANYVVFPIAWASSSLYGLQSPDPRTQYRTRLFCIYRYLFPQVFLSRHFWSIQEHMEFSFKKHKRKLYNYKPVIGLLQAKALKLHDEQLQPRLLTVLYKVRKCDDRWNCNANSILAVAARKRNPSGRAGDIRDKAAVRRTAILSRPFVRTPSG